MGNAAIFLFQKEVRIPLEGSPEAYKENFKRYYFTQPPEFRVVPRADGSFDITSVKRKNHEHTCDATAWITHSDSGHELLLGFGLPASDLGFGAVVFGLFFLLPILFELYSKSYSLAVFWTIGGLIFYFFGLGLFLLQVKRVTKWVKKHIVVSADEQAIPGK